MKENERRIELLKKDMEYWYREQTENMVNREMVDLLSKKEGINEKEAKEIIFEIIVDKMISNGQMDEIIIDIFKIKQLEIPDEWLEWLELN